jgi:hypothetical protein
MLITGAINIPSVLSIAKRFVIVHKTISGKVIAGECRLAFSSIQSMGFAASASAMTFSGMLPG